MGSREDPLDFFATRVPRRHRHKSILFKELWAVLHALRCWASQDWAGTLVTLRMDNTGAVSGLNGGSLDERPSQSLLREIFLIALSFNFSICCVWIDSKSNYLADALSRFDMLRLRSYLPSFFNSQPTPFPRLPTVGLLGSTSHQKSLSFSGMGSRLPLEGSMILPANCLRLPSHVAMAGLSQISPLSHVLLSYLYLICAMWLSYRYHIISYHFPLLITMTYTVSACSHAYSHVSWHYSDFSHH